MTRIIELGIMFSYCKFVPLKMVFGIKRLL